MYCTRRARIDRRRRARAVKPSLAPEEIAALQRADAYPDDRSAARGVERVQTHISDVFLTGERVYKFRKAVDLGFVRFRDPAERNLDCVHELTLNRRLAPDVYLGLAPLRGRGAKVEIGRRGEAPVDDATEHCVVMRRLPAGRDALSLLEAGALTPALLDRLARCIARFHDDVGLGTPAPFAPEAWREVCTAPFRESLAVLDEAARASLRPSSLAAVARRAAAFVAAYAPRLEARRVAGRAVDGHGDLHLQHVWFERDVAEPIVVDCLEFDAGLRRIDAACDVAFAAMDLVYRGRRDLAERFLRVYAAERDDYGLYGVVDYFAAYRAAVRAKVAALAAADPGLAAGQREAAAASASRHLELAGELLAERAPGTLLLVAGSVGAGKSTLAAVLAEAGEPVLIASDRLRKRLAGLAGDTRAGDALYTPEARERVYEALLARARPVLASGRSVVLDATWARRRDRSAAAELARALGARFAVLEATCAPEQARARLAARAARGDDASDAGPDQLEASLAEFEAPGEEERPVWLRFATDADGWQERAAAWIRSGAPRATRTATPQP
jgi:aminoglycoside phosphotransferase family enzyme/predicted kinase